jgi:hypothetical protein
MSWLRERGKIDGDPLTSQSLPMAASKYDRFQLNPLVKMSRPRSEWRLGVDVSLDACICRYLGIRSHFVRGSVYVYMSVSDCGEELRSSRDDRISVGGQHGQFRMDKKSFWKSIIVKPIAITARGRESFRCTGQIGRLSQLIAPISS